MESPAGIDRRAALVAVVVLLVLGAVPLIFWGGSSDDGQDKKGGLLVQRFDDPRRGLEEVLVSFEDPSILTSERPREGNSVDVRCFDPDGQSVMSAREEWPLDTDDGDLAPHVHLPAAGGLGAKVERCTITGLGRAYEGRLAR